MATTDQERIIYAPSPSGKSRRNSGKILVRSPNRVWGGWKRDDAATAVSIGRAKYHKEEGKIGFRGNGRFFPASLLI